MQHPARLGLFARVVCRACAHRVASGTLRKKPGPPVRGPAVLAITVLRGPHWQPKAPVPPARHTTAQRWVGCPLPTRSSLVHAMLAEAFTFASSSVIGYDCVCVLCRARRPQWPCLWGTTRDLRVATAVPPTKPRRSCVVQAPTAVRACGLTVQVAPTATFRCCHRLPARACVQRATFVTLGRPLPPKTHAALRRGECVRGQVERGRTSAQLPFVSVFKLLCVPGVRLSLSARFPPVVSAPQVLPCWLQRACGCQAWRVHPGAYPAHTQQHRPMWQWHVLRERHRPTLSCGSVRVCRPSG